MFQRKLMDTQLEEAGLRIGDTCSIFPFHGHRKSFTLNRNRIDLISKSYRPGDLALAYVELPISRPGHFHYRLELDVQAPGNRFILKTLEGSAFWLNGLAAKEAYVERADRLFIDDNKVRFDSCGLEDVVKESFDHPILHQGPLMTSELNILIEGETGTGKTDLARKIHDKSQRRGNFVAVNLSSFNAQLIESELFGHTKGSFTGAISDRKGAFEEADYGTLFLDEVDSLPLEIQTKLLTFLDQKRFRPVGSSKEKEIRARLIFASGRKLDTLVDQGVMRKDFFYRLRSGQSVQLESLRNNTERIREACKYFAIKNSVSFSERLIDFYLSLAWPGNLRQLFGHLEKKKVLSRGSKLDFDFVDEELMLQSSDLLSLSNQDSIEPMETAKIAHVKRAYIICEGNMSLTARRLQLSEKTVRSLVAKV